MKPFDPRLLRELPEIRAGVGVLAALGVVNGLLSLAVAVSAAILVTEVVGGAELQGPGLGFGGSLLAKGAITAAIEVAAARAGVRTQRAVRQAALTRWAGAAIEEVPAPEHRAAQSAWGANAIEPYVARYLPSLITAATVPFLVIALLIAVDWISALIVVLTLPLLPVFAILIGQHTREQTEHKWRETQLLSGHFADVMRGLPTLVNYQRADLQVSRIAEISERLRRSTVRTLRTAFLSSAALELLATISVAIVAVCVGLRLTHGSIDLRTGLIAILLAPEAYWPIRRVGQEFHSAADGLHSIDRLLPIPDAAPESAAAPWRASAPSARTKPTTSTLSYRYPGAQDVVLDGLSVDISPGLTVLTGPSGAGKTTLLELLAGLRRPSAGSSPDWPDPALVEQRPMLIPGTVAENLGADPASLRVVSPSLESLLAELIAELPDGAATSIGDDGVGLSAGQRQLIALCRGVSRADSTLLLDEPTAHLDPRRAETLIRALRELADPSGRRRVVVVTHDARLVAVADAQVTLRSPHSPPEATTVQKPGREPGREPGRAAAGSTGVASRPEPHVPTAAVRSSLWSAIGLGSMAQLCAVALTATSGWLIVQASTRPVILTLLTAVVSVRAFGIFRPVFSHAERIHSHDVALHRLGLRRAEVYAALIPLTPARLGHRRRGDVLAGATHDVDDEIDALPRGVVPLAATAVTTLIVVALSWWLLLPAGLTVAAAATLVLFVGLGIRRLERLRLAAALDARGRADAATRLLAELGPRLRISGVDAVLFERFEATHDQLRRAVLRQVRLRAGFLCFAHSLIGATTLLVAVAAASATTRGLLSAPVAAMVVLGPFAMSQLLTAVPDAMSSLARGAEARRRLVALTGQTPAVVDPATPVVAAEPGARVLLERASARWTEDPHRLGVPPIDLVLPPGTHLGLSGPNGAGKSTAIAILARHLTASSGKHRYGPDDVRTLRVDEVRSRIAVLDDEPHVFAGTLRANVSLAKPTATDHELVTALTGAGLAGWFGGLPDGLDTSLGSGARGVSGGERTRLALARAVLSGREMLLLDEPVAHLDVPTARAVLGDLRASTRGRTVVVVSHQDIGLDHCDKILELAPVPQPGARPQIEEVAECR